MFMGVFGGFGAVRWFNAVSGIFWKVFQGHARGNQVGSRVFQVYLRRFRSFRMIFRGVSKLFKEFQGAFQDLLGILDSLRGISGGSQRCSIVF